MRLGIVFPLPLIYRAKIWTGGRLRKKIKHWLRERRLTLNFCSVISLGTVWFFLWSGLHMHLPVSMGIPVLVAYSVYSTESWKRRGTFKMKSKNLQLFSLELVVNSSVTTLHFTRCACCIHYSSLIDVARAAAAEAAQAIYYPRKCGLPLHPFKPYFWLRFSFLNFRWKIFTMIGPFLCISTRRCNWSYQTDTLECIEAIVHQNQVHMDSMGMA